MYFSICQSISVHTGKETDSKFCSIYSSKFYFRTTAALPFDVPGTFYDVFGSKVVYFSACGSNGSKPVIFSCILPYGIFEHFRYFKHHCHLPSKFLQRKRNRPQSFVGCILFKL